MDIDNKVNKMVDGSASVNKADSPTTVKAVSPMFNEYFFPGGGVWKPMSVKALTIEDAQETYRQKREPVSPAEKVELPKESSNE